MFKKEPCRLGKTALRPLLMNRLSQAAVYIPLCLQAAAIAADAPAIPRFVEETDSSGLQSRFEGEGEFLVGGGVATFDCDGDGLPEVYVTAGVNKAKFYRNRSTRGGPIKLQEERSGQIGRAHV